MPESRQQLLPLLSGVGLERLASPLMTLALPSVRLLSYANAGDESAIGVTKIGGVPDVPDGWRWPVKEDTPLSFIAQINLKEAASSYMAEYVLPSAGLLSFFYEADKQPWGFDPKDRGGWKVFYFSPESGTLNRAAMPPEVIRLGQFEPCSVEFASEWTVPDIASDVEALHDLSEAEFHAFFDFEDCLYTPQSEKASCMHRLLGHPQHIQNTMQMECQLASNGVYCGEVTGYQSVEVQALAPGASDWQLLLQIDSDEDAGMMWGDMGRIYYWIRKQDLAVCNFDAVWLVLQCS